MDGSQTPSPSAGGVSFAFPLPRMGGAGRKQTFIMGEGTHIQVGRIEAVAALQSLQESVATIGRYAGYAGVAKGFFGR